MKRLVISTILKMVGEAIGIALIAGIIVGVIGYKNKWDTPLPWSNAFFIAGCLLIVAGGLSRMAAGQEWKSSQLLDMESFRGMSNSERADFVVSASSSLRLVILGLLSGLLLIIVSAFLANMS